MRSKKDIHRSISKQCRCSGGTFKRKLEQFALLIPIRYNKSYIQMEGKAMNNKQSRGTMIPLYLEIQKIGRELVKKIKLLIREALDLCLVVKQSDGNKLFKIPFIPAALVGIGIMLIAPFLAALAVIPFLAGWIETDTECYPKPVYIKVETTEINSQRMPKS
jgi:hypothetical protein